MAEGYQLVMSDLVPCKLYSAQLYVCALVLCRLHMEHNLSIMRLNTSKAETVAAFLMLTMH